MAKPLTFTITANEGDALSAFSALSKSAVRDMKKVEDALDDSRTAMQKFADSLSADADQIAAELAGVKQASGILQEQLGADWAESSADVDKFILDLRKAGFTFDEIEADAESLAVAIRKLDDVNLNKATGEAKQLDTALEGVSHQTDKSRSVMANFAGNAAQEIPGVTNAMGPLNTAIGQFAEYAAEGDINMRGLASAFGPMLAGAAGLAVAQHLMGQWSAATEASNEAVRNLTERLRDGESAAQAFRHEMEETGKVTVATFSLFGSGAKDATDDLFKAGLSIDQVTELVDGGKPAIQEWAKAMRDAGMDAGVVYDALVVLAVKASEVERAEAAAAMNAYFFRDALEYTGDQAAQTAAIAESLGAGINTVTVAAAGATPPIDTLGVAFGATANAAGEASDDAKRFEDALISLNDTVLAQADSQLALERAWNGAQDQLAAYNEVVGDSKSTAEDTERATIELKQSYLDVAEAAGRDAVEALGAAATEAEKSEAKNKAMRDSLGLLATSLEPGSDAYEAVMGWIAALKKIPMNLTTKIGATFVGNTPGASKTGAKEGFDDGGVVPGALGSPQLILAHGGELMVPAHKPGFDPSMLGGGPTVIVQVAGSVVTKDQLIDEVHRGLLRKERSERTLRFT